MSDMEGPFTITQDTINTLEIRDKNENLVCQFYEGDCNISESTMAKAKFVTDAINEKWSKENQ